MTTKLQLNGLRRSRSEEEHGQDEEYRLELWYSDVACLYKDRNGVFITTKGGKSFRVNHTLEELKEYVKEV